MEYNADDKPSFNKRLLNERVFHELFNRRSCSVEGVVRSKSLEQCLGKVCRSVFSRVLQNSSRV